MHKLSQTSLRTVAAALFLLTLSFTSTASASHYFVSDIAERFTSTQVTEFARFGLQTTEDVLRNVDTREDRASLASATGISTDELVEVARMCDFLQIDGIGPRAYDLLRASGVHSVADLAQRDAESLHAEIVTVNAVERITGVDPEVELVAQWITFAAQVPIRVAY